MRSFRLDTLFKMLFLLGWIFLSPACAPFSSQSTETATRRIVWSGVVTIDRDMVFPAETELIVLPGTEIVFLPTDPQYDTFSGHPHFIGYELVIHGTVNAVGTAEQPIVFRAADPDAAPGSWGGINLVGSAGARFEYCRFSQADSAIHSQKSSVAVEQSVFDHNLVGVRFHDSEMLIEHNLFERNRTAIRFHFGAPVICLNVIRNNEQGLFITSYPRDYHIENNSFEQNRRGNVILGELVPGDVVMPRNYWGTTDPEQISASFYDGQRDDYIGRVRFIPLRTEPVAGSGAAWSR